jgi:hypothetical protein
MLRHEIVCVLEVTPCVCFWKANGYPLDAWFWPTAVGRIRSKTTAPIMLGSCPVIIGHFTFVSFTAKSLNGLAV